MGWETLAIVLVVQKDECRISEPGNEHGISQGIYCKWRDQLLQDGVKLSERDGVDHTRERLAKKLLG